MMTVHFGSAAAGGVLPPLLLLLLLPAYTNSFVHPRSLARPSLLRSSPRNVKEVATFDSSDFAGATGSWPYTDADMGRLDPTDDSNFYDSPRFVTHIDDGAIGSLRAYYASTIAEGSDVLDICSSWISHLPEPEGTPPREDPRYGRRPMPIGSLYGRVEGLGMNDAELSMNRQLSGYTCADLNKEPKLPYDDASFDVVTCVVSVDYLTKPFEVFQEIHRVLRPGGQCLMSFSNRCFPSKAVAMWLQADDIGRMTIVASYFHYAAAWASIQALDIKIRDAGGVPGQAPLPPRPSPMEILKNPSAALEWAAKQAAAAAGAMGGDPMYMVRAVKE